MWLPRTRSQDGSDICPYAKNLVADAVKEIIDAYRAQNPNLKYVIFVGSDNDIPFYRVPDTTELGQEENYFVPVDPFPPRTPCSVRITT